MNRMTRRAAAVTIAGGAALGLVGGAFATKPKVGPPPPKLFAVVDPATTKVSLKDGHGTSVGHLKSGWYTLTITDSNPGQRFRLQGPGINRTTAAHFVGAAIWGVHLLKGTYSYSSFGPKTVIHKFSVG
jgi:hypothetical protein